jgi:hypothetical protein
MGITKLMLAVYIEPRLGVEKLQDLSERVLKHSDLGAIRRGAELYRAIAAAIFL